jgi:NAD(P)-dependent dehydrogenase (short-subunit alcohol dehydrogenase family)
VSELLDALRPRRLGRIDLLVNNAAHYDPKPLFETTLEDFDLAFRINVRAVFQLSQAIARRMIGDGGGGSIVNIASIAGKLGSPVVSYGASKAAVIGLTRSMAKSLGGQGVRVNAVAPGMIRSPMSKAIAEPQLRAQLASTAMNRLGEPDEIARVVAFLASPAASYMTGAVVDVAGGWMS